MKSAWNWKRIPHSSKHLSSGSEIRMEGPLIWEKCFFIWLFVLGNDNSGERLQEDSSQVSPHVLLPQNARPQVMKLSKILWFRHLRYLYSSDPGLARSLARMKHSIQSASKKTGGKNYNSCLDSTFL